MDNKIKTEKYLRCLFVLFFYLLKKEKKGKEISVKNSRKVKKKILV